MMVVDNLDAKGKKWHCPMKKFKMILFKKKQRATSIIYLNNCVPCGKCEPGKTTYLDTKNPAVRLIGVRVQSEK